MHFIEAQDAHDGVSFAEPLPFVLHDVVDYSVDRGSEFSVVNLHVGGVDARFRDLNLLLVDFEVVLRFLDRFRRADPFVILFLDFFGRDGAGHLVVERACAFIRRLGDARGGLRDFDFQRLRRFLLRD